MEGQPNYLVSNGKIEKLDSETLPVECYFISTYAMRNIGEERGEQGNLTQVSYESTEMVNYLFDVNGEG